MRRIDAGVSGGTGGVNANWARTELPEEWVGVLRAALPGASLRPVQERALLQARILESRRNLVVSAPTNSGKSLVGDVVLLDAVRRGKRAVLLEPLRVLAREKSERLKDLLDRLPKRFLPGVPAVVLSTGDYRLEDESFADPPPSAGEIVVATPERMDAILRRPDSAPWLETIGAVVVDEGHLIGNLRRGPILEFVLALAKSGSRPPRIVLLSATIGNPEELVRWLEPCDLVLETERVPPLAKEVVELGDDEGADEALLGLAREALGADGAALLVFVYQRNSCGVLAERLSSELGRLCGEAGALAFHSGMSAAQRLRVEQRYRSGECRCVVTTTALSLGVNLPATHVIVRDSTFYGHGRLGVDELLQMMGRAGRGDRSGRAAVLIRPGDRWDAQDLAEALREERSPDISSAFDTGGGGARFGQQDTIEQLVASCLLRFGEEGATTQDLEQVAANLFAKTASSGRIQAAARRLTSPERLLAHQREDGRLRLTALGARGVGSVLPLPLVGGFGQLVRDLLTAEENDYTLRRWTALDHLIVLHLMSERMPTLRRYSRALADHVDGWVERAAQDDKPVLFTRWGGGAPGGSKAEMLLGSLGIGGPGQSADDARAALYQSAFHSAVVLERARGTSIAEVEARWEVAGLEGVEERWRDTLIWLLAGLGRLCDIRCFLYHLKTECHTSDTRLADVRRYLRRMSILARELREELKYCSPLGSVLVGVRRNREGSSGPTVGVGTLRRLEAAGITQLRQLAKMDVAQLTALGTQERYARQILRYVRRRLT